MPVPIGLVGRNPEKIENNGLLDVSFLANQQQEDHREAGILSAVISDKDADDLMNIWLHADKKGKDTFDVRKTKISNDKLIRLKSRGLLSGGTEQVKITPKGKTVVSTMTLGENNKFLEKRQKKSYTEILASMDKSNKQGYRIPKFASSSCSLNLTSFK